MSAIDLFGGSSPWSSKDWTSSDDRVRGGSSQSYLDCSSSSARFHGNLDTKTLGGAGFASQRTVGEDKVWDLSAYEGIELDIVQADEKRYTFLVKDELLPRSPNGREQSTISWEYDFLAEKNGEKLFVKWEDFKPTYRGKEKNDAEPLKLESIKRISIMNRSFFATQEGPFSLTIRSIAAVKAHTSIKADSDTSSIRKDTNSIGNKEAIHKENGWLARLFGSCCVS